MPQLIDDDRLRNTRPRGRGGRQHRTQYESVVLAHARCRCDQHEEAPPLANNPSPIGEALRQVP